VVMCECACVRVQIEHTPQFSLTPGVCVMLYLGEVVKFLRLNIKFESGCLLNCDDCSQDNILT
jgi:hypothetical protein